MTAARHRSAAAATADRPEGPGLKGKAPGGMWWVAWRQHRLQIAVVFALIAVLIAALITFREVVIARFTAAGCDLAASSCAGANGGDIWYTGLSMWHSLLEAAVILAPIVLGAFAGGPIFTREFSRGTHVFALTQSVSRRRWWITKIVVMGVPLLAGLVALGFVAGWVDSTTGYTAHGALGTNQFATRAIIPAAHGLAAFAIAVAAGILTRSTVASLVSGLIVAGLAVVGMIFVQPHVLPATRQVTPIETSIDGSSSTSLRDKDPDIRWAGFGYLDTDGHEMPLASLNSCYAQGRDAGDKAVGITDSEATDATSGGAAMSPQEYQAQNSPEYQDAFNHALLDCAHDKGIAAEFQDYLPGSLVWPLRWAMTGIAAVLAALFLWLAAARLPAAVAKR